MSDLLQWKEGVVDCGYNNLSCMTPFGRILVTWKGWKEPNNWDFSIDEHPVSSAIGYVGGSPEETKEMAESKYIDALRIAQPATGAQVTDDTEVLIFTLRDQAGMRLMDNEEDYQGKLMLDAAIALEAALAQRKAG